MNIIQQQTIDFFENEFQERSEYEEFIQKVRSKLYDYRKDAHKLEFIEYLMGLLKKGYDKHLTKCHYPNDRSKCVINKNYENCLFFIQNERDDIIEILQPTDFNLNEKTEINESLQKIIDDLDKIKMGQELTYDDFMEELSELKEYYFLNKKNWTQLLIGKLSEMVAAGIISETLCKGIVETVTKNYDGLI